MQLGREMSEINDELEYAIRQLGGQIEKPVKFIMPPRSSFSLTLHCLFQERIIETKNEININSLVQY